MKTNKTQPWKDHYTFKAKKENYPARSVYKLKEIQQKNRLIRKGDNILDLGCAPGSWLLYASELTGATGRVIGIDLQPLEIQFPSHVQVLRGDVLEWGDELKTIVGKDFDGVISDLAPSTTGNKRVDAIRSFNLCQAALSIALTVLKPGGYFVCKIFQGEDFKQFTNDVKASFEQQRIFKPQSSRKASKEIFIIGIGKKQEEHDVRT